MSKSNTNHTWLRHKITLPAFVIAGIILAVVIVKSQAPMVHQTETKASTTVNVIEAQSFNVSPQIKGFGEVTPDILLDGKSEISGKVIYVHPQLKPGAILPKDTLVISIEENDYQLALKKAEAELTVSQANLKELDINLIDAKVDLLLIEERLVISQKELKRSQNLIKKGSISQSKFDAQRSSTLQLKQEVQNLQNKLATLPSQREVLIARVSIAQSNVETQKRNLERTAIRLPFTARISEEFAENNQFVSQGTLLFKAQNIDRILVNAQFPLAQFQLLAKGFKQDINIRESIQKAGTSESIFSQLGLSATISIAGNIEVKWPAKVERILSNLDPSSRTLGIIVSIDNPYEDIRPGIKPPLIEGMFTEVILKGQPRRFTVVPRDALHENELYLVGPDAKLQRKPVSFDAQGAMALIERGLQAGEKVITSDLFPAVTGMSLNPVADAVSLQQINDWLKEQ